MYLFDWSLSRWQEYRLPYISGIFGHRRRPSANASSAIIVWAESYEASYRCRRVLPHHRHRIYSPQFRSSVLVILSDYRPPCSTPTPQTLTDCHHSRFSKFPAYSLLLFRAAINKFDFRQIAESLAQPSMAPASSSIPRNTTVRALRD